MFGHIIAKRSQSPEWSINSTIAEAAVPGCRCESGNDLVATIINQGGGAEFEGLNLHAIASASIEVGDGLVRGLAGSTAGVAAAELSPAGSSA